MATGRYGNSTSMPGAAGVNGELAGGARSSTRAGGDKACWVVLHMMEAGWRGLYPVVRAAEVAMGSVRQLTLAAPSV